MDQTELMETEGDSGQAIQLLLRVCKKGRWLIASTALFAAVTVTVGLQFVPSKYRSEATILIAEQQISTTLVTPLSTMSAADRLQAMTREVLSRSRLLDICSEFGLFAKERKSSPDAAVEEMRKALEVEPIDVKQDRQDQFSAFSISFTAETPQLAQGVTRTLASLFIERNLESQANRARSTTDFLQDQVADKRKRLEDIDQRIRDFKIQHSGALPEERAANEVRRGEASSQLDAATASLSRAKGQRVVWESTLTGELNSRLGRLKIERAQLLKTFTPMHPQVVGKDEQITQLEAELNWVQSGAPAAQKPRSSLNGESGINQLEAQLQANTLEIESLSDEVARRTSSVTQYERRLGSTSIWEQQLAGMVRESENLNADIADVQKKQQQTGLAVDMEKRQEGQQFKQLDPASFPLRPFSPQRLKMSFAAAGGGALFGFLFALLFDLLNPSFHTEDELRKRFAPPLLLSIPAIVTVKEQRAHTRRTGFEVVAGVVVMVAILAVEFYSYRHP